MCRGRRVVAAAGKGVAVDDLGGFTGGVLRLAVGGLPVWVVLGGSGVIVWRAWKRRRSEGAQEPAPRFQA